MYLTPACFSASENVSAEDSSLQTSDTQKPKKKKKKKKAPQKDSFGPNKKDSSFNVFIEPALNLIGGVYTQEMDLWGNKIKSVSSGYGGGLSLKTGLSFKFGVNFHGGLDASYGMISFTKGKTTTSTTGDTTVTESSSESDLGSAKMINVGPYLGITLFPDSAVGLIVSGGLIAYDSLTDKDGDSMLSQLSSFRLGLGMILPLNITIRLDYTQHSYNKIKTKSGTTSKLPVEETNAGLTIKMSEPKFQTATLSIGYWFNFL